MIKKTPERNHRPASRRGSEWRSALVALAGLFMLANGLPASAENNDATLKRTETYAGVLGGVWRSDNQIVDVDGFANWGHPGSIFDYRNTGFVGGGLIGRKLTLGGVPLRIELDGTFGDLSAKTRQLDPLGLDETAEARFRWVTTARAGIEQVIDGATVFATGGLATAGITNSVTDIDFSPDMPPEVDPDDSFHDSSTEIGWVIGGGIETPLTAAWSLRFEGSYVDFGRGTHQVNRSGNNRCGPGNPRRPCSYNVENKLGIVRWAIIYRFGQ